MHCRFPKSHSGRFVACFLLLCMALAGIVSLPQVARATGEYQIHEISQNPGRYPMVNDRRDVVWMENANGLFFHDAFTGETKQLSTEAYIYYYDVNSQGDVGWDTRSNWQIGEDGEVYIYDHSNRTTLQVTNNDWDDRFYKITDDGTVYFVSKVPDGSFSLSYYVIDTGETLTVETFDQFSSWPMEVNANGDVLWIQRDSSYIRHAYLYSAATRAVIPIGSHVPGGWYTNMNDGGDVSYVQQTSDFWAVWLYVASSGQTSELAITFDTGWSMHEPKTSNNGNVIWTGGGDIFYYDQELDFVEKLTEDPGTGYGFWDKDINDNGDAAWIDWNPRPSGKELNIYLHGEGRIETINTAFSPMVSEPEWPQINNNGDVVFEGNNDQPWGQGLYLATRTATAAEVVEVIEELAASGSLDTNTAEDLQSSFEAATEAFSSGDEQEAEKAVDQFEKNLDKEEAKGNLSGDEAKKIKDALDEVANSF